MLIKKLIFEKLDNFHLVLALLFSLIFLAFRGLDFLTFLATCLVFNFYIRTLNFSMSTLMALGKKNDYQESKLLSSVKIFISIIRAVFFAALLFIMITFFKASTLAMFVALIVFILSMAFFSIFKNKFS